MLDDPWQPMTHGILYIAPSFQTARDVWAASGLGNWAAAFPLRLERAGLLDFDVADEHALDTSGKLENRDLLIIAHLPDAAWTQRRQEMVRSYPGCAFLEGPVPEAVFPAARAVGTAGRRRSRSG